MFPHENNVYTPCCKGGSVPGDLNQVSKGILVAREHGGGREQSLDRRQRARACAFGKAPSCWYFLFTSGFFTAAFVGTCSTPACS
jgi:hypothetical protein